MTERKHRNVVCIIIVVYRIKCGTGHKQETKRHIQMRVIAVLRQVKLDNTSDETARALL